MNRFIRKTKRYMPSSRTPASQVQLAGSVLLVFLLGAGCGRSDADVANGDDPIKALTVPQRSSRYGSTFWTRKAITDPKIWASAVAYCEGRNDGDHPNCEAVRYVRMMERMSRLPEDRPNDFRLMLPEVAEPDDAQR